MNKPEALRILRLLSALESALMCERTASTRIPDYLFDELVGCAEILEKQVLQ